MAVQTVWLIRHGRTDWNDQHRWQGQAPTSLNAEGHDQARRLAAHLKDKPIQKIYTSDLPRALQTAEALAAALELDPILEPRLRELNVGVFQALFPDELRELYPDELEAWHNGDLHHAMPNGESRHALQTRALSAFSDIAAQDNHTDVALVSHGGTLRQLVHALQPEGTPEKERFPVPNTSYTRLTRNGDGWRIDELAAAPHLTDDSARGNTGQTSY